MHYVDYVRCEKHAGEVFPVRCYACEALVHEYEVFRVQEADL
jgi:hypothetical protein